MKRAIAGAVRETSTWLGNTPAMSRKSYIDPAVIEAYARGEVVRHALERPEVLIASGRPGLDRSEWELLLLLRRERPARRRNRAAAPGAGRRDRAPRTSPAPLPVRPDAEQAA
jgi:DNA topoisomerase IB